MVVDMYIGSSGPRDSTFVSLWGVPEVALGDFLSVTFI